MTDASRRPRCHTFESVFARSATLHHLAAFRGALFPYLTLNSTPAGPGSEMGMTKPTGRGKVWIRPTPGAV